MSHIDRSIAALAMYFIIGAILMKFKFQKTGADIVPQKDFWISFPLLLKVSARDDCVHCFTVFIGLLYAGRMYVHIWSTDQTRS